VQLRYLRPSDWTLQHQQEQMDQGHQQETNQQDAAEPDAVMTDHGMVHANMYSGSGSRHSLNA
jgi:hypothetical protein